MNTSCIRKITIICALTLLLLAPFTVLARSSSIDTDRELTDFSGGVMPERARELIGKSFPPIEPGVRPGRLPVGWIERDGFYFVGWEFPTGPELRQGVTGLSIDQLYKKGDRVGIITKIDKDRQITVTDFFAFAFAYKERATERCDVRGHQLPENSTLIGFLHKDDPNRQPKPRRPTHLEAIEYSKNNSWKYHPRQCLGNLQTARKAAILDLSTGKLKLYEGKQKVVCVSPFVEICPP